jgi:FKBP-type peptidyl-prolyl cis-trans isomerase FkpA
MPISIKKSFLVLGAFYFIFLFSSCTSQPEDKKQAPGIRDMKEGLLGANTLLIDAEEQEIQDFIDRHGWKMEDTGSGLKYMIYHRGNGEFAQKDQIAYIHYSIRLITGDLIYTSHQDGLKNFRIGRGGVESGLEEGILLMRKGDKARFVMPSHLAHGLPGDGVKIPRRATIVYDLELVDLK